jgi:uncharacterized Zn-finger protein
MIKWFIQKVCDAQAEAKLKAEAKMAVENKKKEYRESPICPYCKKRHPLTDLKGTATRSEYIDFGQMSRITFVECPKCEKVFCLAVYVDDNMNMVIDGFAIHDKEVKKDV